MKYYDIIFDNCKYYDVMVADLSLTLVLSSSIFMDNFHLEGEDDSSIILNEYSRIQQIVNNKNTIKLDDSKIHYKIGFKEKFYNENIMSADMKFNVSFKEQTIQNNNIIEISLNSLDEIKSNIIQTNKIKVVITTPTLRTLGDVLNNNQTLNDIIDMTLQEFYFKDTITLDS